MARGNKTRRGGGGARGSHRGKAKNYTNKPNRKREFESGYDRYRKRAKFDDTPAATPREEPEVSSDSSEDEQQQHPFKQLLSTFASATQQARLAATVSDESDESESQEEVGSDAESATTSDDGGSGFSGSALEEKNGEKVMNAQDSEEDEPPALGTTSTATNDIDTEPLEEENEEDTTEKESPEKDDPFTRHLQWDLSPSLLASVSSEDPTRDTQTLSWPCLGKLVLQIPHPLASPTQSKPKVTLQEDETFAPVGSLPQRTQTVNWDKLFVKQQIQSHIKSANSEIVKEGELTLLQTELFSILNNYQDLYYPDRAHSTAEEVRFAYCLHAVNHVLKTRLKVLHHNARLAKKSEVPDEYRDQGLVRPKVLILLPFKDAALRTVNMLASILLGSTKGTIMNYKRFAEEFGGSQLSLPRKNPRPEDYEQIFTGNTDDTFRIGITVTKKCFKLYADFYHSDIIIASPLGLRMIIGAEGEVSRDFDFLASLELLVMDQADVFLQQNWDHVLHLWDHLHRQPRESHDADFSRVRSWALAGHTRYYRQTLLLSSVALPELTALLNRRCHNYAGAVRVVNPITTGAICHVLVHLPQVFHRLEASTPSQALDARFDMFTSKVLPQYREALMSHCLVLVSSYFDFVRLRNYLKREDMGFVQICEYSKEGKIARARDMFFHNDAHFLLYSERFHFFRRIRIKGIRHLIFYQPPVYPHFYSEMCNLMQEVNQNPREGGGTETNMSVTVLYSRYDAQRLAGIVGTERATRMLASERKVHMMVTGE